MVNEHRNHERDLQREEKEKGKEEVLVVGVTHRGGEAKRVGVYISIYLSVYLSSIYLSIQGVKDTS